MNELIVWGVEWTTMDPTVRELLERRLDDAERKRYEGFCYPQRSTQFLIARAAIKMQLEVEWGLSASRLRIGCAPGEQPKIEGAAGPAISVAHCKGLVLVASARAAAIGVDVAPVVRCDGVLADRFFSSPECDWLDSLARQDARYRFAQMWAVKEACSKARGTNLFPLEPLSVPLPASYGDGPVAWTLLETGSDLAAAVAVSGPIDGRSFYRAISLRELSARDVAGQS